MAEFTTITNSWDKGITDDPRDSRRGVARMITGFDALTNPTKLTPRRSTEDGDSDAGENKRQNFALAEGKLFARGVISDASSFTEVNFKNISDGGTSDLGDNLWDTIGTTAKHQATSGASSGSDFNLFTYYKKTGLIYGASAGTQITAYDPTGSADFDETEQALTYSNIEEGLVHSNDILYVPYDNMIASNDNGSWNTTALTLPTHFTITSIAQFGNYLAIACKGNSVYENSKVFLWDTNSTLWSEEIDWGDGELKIIHQVDGELIGISIKKGNASFQDKVIFRRYAQGNVAVKFLELQGGINTTLLPTMKQQVDNRLFFQMVIELNGAFRAGLWSLGRSSIGSPFALVNHNPANGDTAFTGSDQQNGFIVVGDYSFMSMQISTTWTLNKTNDDEVFTQKSVLETVINPDMPEKFKRTQKQIVAIALSYPTLPTNGQVVLEYRVDGGSYITIFTETTTGGVFTEQVIDANGDQFDDGREYEYRVTSTLGAEMVEIRAKYETVDTQLN